MYSLDPTPIDNYYQCYTEYDKDDDENTITTSNLRENKSENLSGAAREFIKQELRTVDKHLSGQVVEPVASPKVAKRGTRVQTLLREAEAQGRASVPTT